MSLQQRPQFCVVLGTQRDRLDQRCGIAPSEEFRRKKRLALQVHAEPRRLRLHQDGALSRRDIDRLAPPRDARIPFREDECVNPPSPTGRSSIDQAELFEQKASHRLLLPTRHRTFQLAHSRDLLFISRAIVVGSHSPWKGRVIIRAGSPARRPARRRSGDGCPASGLVGM